jgi:hypothetical protein
MLPGDLIPVRQLVVLAVGLVGDMSSENFVFLL